MSAVINHPIEIPDLLRQCFSSTVIGAVPFLRIYPDKELNGPVIVWRLVRRWPGKDKKETKRGRLRAISEADPDKVTMYFGQWQTSMFQFDLLHINDFEADRLMLNFERAVKECQAAMANRGVDSFFFEEQLEDSSIQVSKAVKVRSLRFLATMTVYTAVDTARIREILLRVAETPLNQVASIVKSSGDTDTIEMRLSDLLSIYSIEDDPSSIFLGGGIDYTAEDLNNGTIQITWTDFGLHPLPGDTFFISHSTMSDPVTRTVH